MDTFLSFTSYPLLLAGIFLLLRELGSVRTRAAILDSVIVAVAAGTVQWVFFVEPYLHTSLQPFTRLVEKRDLSDDGPVDVRRAR